MDIADASTYFDDDPVYDGYTGAFLFNGQLDAFNDSHGDGSTSRRRVLSTGPGFAMPARSVVTIYGERWLVGTSTTDGFGGDAVRQHQSMKKITDLLTLYTPGQLLTNAAGVALYAQKLYFKDGTDGLDNAEIDTFWHIFVAATEAASKGYLLKDAGGRLHRVRNDYLSIEGLRVCQSDTLDTGALQTATWGTGTYDPVNDTVSAGSSSVNVVAFDTSKFYQFRHLSDASNAKGDMAVLVPTTVTPNTGDTFAMGGTNWRVLSAQAELDAWTVHARRV